MKLVCRCLAAFVVGAALAHAADPLPSKVTGPLTVVVREGDRMVSDSVLKVTWADVAPEGKVRWSPTGKPGSAQAWVASLNAKHGGRGYGGFNNWRLATGVGTEPFSPVNSANELASLFFTELGNTPFEHVTRLEPFTALNNDLGYWSGSRFAQTPEVRAWGFNTGNGRQFRDTFAPYSAIAVRNGQVTAVPALSH